MLVPLRVFIKAEEIARLNAILFKARRYGYLPTDLFSLDDLLDASDESLFTSTRQSSTRFTSTPPTA